MDPFHLWYVSNCNTQRLLNWENKWVTYKYAYTKWPIQSQAWVPLVRIQHYTRYCTIRHTCIHIAWLCKQSMMVGKMIYFHSVSEITTSKQLKKCQPTKLFKFKWLQVLQTCNYNSYIKIPILNSVLKRPWIIYWEADVTCWISLLKYLQTFKKPWNPYIQNQNKGKLRNRFRNLQNGQPFLVI